METYSIAMATDCPFDSDFFELIEKSAHKKGLSTYIIYPYNFDETISDLNKNKIRFLSYYDRASDTSLKFLKFYSAAIENHIHYFTDLDRQKRAADKSIMHDKFVMNNIRVPRSIILPEFTHNPILDLYDTDLDIVGKPFVIKPSVHTGAGSGVFLKGYSLNDIQEKRQEFPQDKYLIQEKIYPKEINQKRFWFRSFYICGKIITCWWNDYGHRYGSLREEDYENVNIGQIELMMKKISVICGLNFFSTEIAITDQDKMYAIDYVNEICDMRLQSKHIDGIPDDIVESISEELVRHIDQKIH